MNPSLKWAGGKTRQRKNIIPHLRGGGRLLVPFAGAGGLWLGTDYDRYRINDINSDLIMFHAYVQDEGPVFINECSDLFVPEANTKQFYYAARTLFNNLPYGIFKASLFLYLNRHCYNGLCRYNSKGEFNVPMGRYKNPKFPDKELLFLYEKMKGDVILTSWLFVDFMNHFVKSGDDVYCDPPYYPLSDTANFTSYAGNVFGHDQHVMLADQARTAAKKGADVLISNHDLPVVREMYHDADEIISFDVQRNISRDGQNRKKAKELLAIWRADP